MGIIISISFLKKYLITINFWRNDVYPPAWPHFENIIRCRSVSLESCLFPKFPSLNALATTTSYNTTNGGDIVKIYKCNIPKTIPLTQVTCISKKQFFLMFHLPPCSSCIRETQLYVQEWDINVKRVSPENILLSSSIMSLLWRNTMFYGPSFTVIRNIPN